MNAATNLQGLTRKKSILINPLLVKEQNQLPLSNTLYLEILKNRIT